MSVQSILGGILCALLVPLAGCGDESAAGGPPTVVSPSGVYELEIDPDTWAPKVGSTGFSFQVMGADGPVEGVEWTQIEPWMVVHGHGSTETPRVTTTGTVHVVENLLYTMPGRWDVRMNAEIDGKPEAFVVEVTVR